LPNDARCRLPAPQVASEPVQHIHRGIRVKFSCEGKSKCNEESYIRAWPALQNGK
jgi:hypothetical protein